jgi:uncharacterized sporulation protein YeaH/YhbH (DUF444 family)
MSQIVDSRQRAERHGRSRERFLDRNRDSIRDAIDRAIGDPNGSIEDIGKGGIEVRPKGGISEPTIRHGQGGRNQHVAPGNKEFVPGDLIARPKGGSGGGGAGPGQGGKAEGDDDFIFRLDEEEFWDYYFRDLELPNMTKEKQADTENFRLKRSGFASSGAYNRLDLPRTKMKKMGRLLATQNPYNEQIISLLEEEKDILKSCDPEAQPGTRPALSLRSQWISTKEKIVKLERQVGALSAQFRALASPGQEERIREIEHEIESLAKGRARIPSYNESTDPRYRNFEQKSIPQAKAVMVCLMDVSGSMSEEMKDRAKRFYILLHRFLKQRYKKVDLVFVRHTETARECTEHEFFYDPDTGGTVVSAGIKEVAKILKARYPESEWNIYGAQTSDGDNSGSDNDTTKKCLTDLLPLMQGYYYVEVGGGGHMYGARQETSLWQTYKSLAEKFQNRFWMGKVNDKKEIGPLFRKLFEKKLASGSGQSRATAFGPT